MEVYFEKNCCGLAEKCCMAPVIGGSYLSFKHAQLEYGEREEQAKLTRTTKGKKCELSLTNKVNNRFILYLSADGRGY